MAFGATGLAAVLAAALVLERRGADIRAYVVPVDDLGRPGRVHLLDPSYKPTEAEAAFFVADWVRLVRAKSIDAVVVRDNWNRAYSLVTGEAARRLDLVARTTDPMSKIGEEAVTAQITSVLQRSSRTYEVNWRETRYVRGGRSVETRWTALITVEAAPPRDEAELRANPLGLKIVGFEWNQEL